MEKHKFTATARDNGNGTLIITIPSFWVSELKINPGDAVRMAILKEAN